MRLENTDIQIAIDNEMKFNIYLFAVFDWTCLYT